MGSAQSALPGRLRPPLPPVLPVRSGPGPGLGRRGRSSAWNPEAGAEEECDQGSSGARE